MGKESVIDLHSRRISIHPASLINERPHEFVHKILVLEIGTTAKKIQAALNCGGYHSWMLKRFPSLYNVDQAKFKRDDVKVYGARFGLLPHKDSHALVVGGHSTDYRNIPADMGLALARKISQILRQMQDADRQLKKKDRQWPDIDWQWVGTAKDVSPELILEDDLRK